MSTKWLPACLLLLSLALICSCSCNGPSDEELEKKKSQDSLTARISRGNYLVSTICNCMHCHADRDYTKFSGPVIKGTEGKGGEQIEPGIYVKNITPFALANWTDEELFKVLTTGIRKNGDTLTMIMPYWNYVKMPKEEIYSIIAYLRTLKPVENKVHERNLDSATKSFWSIAYQQFYLKEAAIKMPLPDTADKVQTGAYLVNAGNCKGCHSIFDAAKMDFSKENYLAGGNLFEDSALHIKVNTANLTPDTATGIGGWSEEVFLSKFKSFRNPKSYDYAPGKYNSFMPWTMLGQVTDNDLKAIYAYLRSIKPVANKVVKWPE